MFEAISERLSRTLGKLRPGARLTEDNIGEALREVRRALLEADVALPVARDFLDRVRERAVGQEVLKSLTPGQAQNPPAEPLVQDAVGRVAKFAPMPSIGQQSKTGSDFRLADG